MGKEGSGGGKGKEERGMEGRERRGREGRGISWI